MRHMRRTQLTGGDPRTAPRAHYPRRGLVSPERRVLFSPPPSPPSISGLPPFADDAALPQDIIAAFNHYDRNCSGYLDYRELHRALGGFGIDTTLQETIDLLRRCVTLALSEAAPPAECTEWPQLW